MTEKSPVNLPHPLDLFNHLKNTNPRLAEKINFYDCVDIVSAVAGMNRDGLVSTTVGPALSIDKPEPNGYADGHTYDRT